MESTQVPWNPYGQWPVQWPQFPQNLPPGTTQPQSSPTPMPTLQTKQATPQNKPDLPFQTSQSHPTGYPSQDPAVGFQPLNYPPQTPNFGYPPVYPPHAYPSQAPISYQAASSYPTWPQSSFSGMHQIQAGFGIGFSSTPGVQKAQSNTAQTSNCNSNQPQSTKSETTITPSRSEASTNIVSSTSRENLNSIQFSLSAPLKEKPSEVATKRLSDELTSDQATGPKIEGSDSRVVSEAEGEPAETITCSSSEESTIQEGKMPQEEPLLRKESHRELVEAKGEISLPTETLSKLIRDTVRAELAMRPNSATHAQRRGVMMERSKPSCDSRPDVQGKVHQYSQPPYYPIFFPPLSDQPYELLNTRRPHRHGFGSELNCQDCNPNVLSSSDFSSEQQFTETDAETTSTGATNSEFTPLSPYFSSYREYDIPRPMSTEPWEGHQTPSYTNLAKPHISGRGTHPSRGSSTSHQTTPLPTLSLRDDSATSWNALTTTPYTKITPDELRKLQFQAASAYGDFLKKRHPHAKYTNDDLESWAELTLGSQTTRTSSLMSSPKVSAHTIDKPAPTTLGSFFRLRGGNLELHGSDRSESSHLTVTSVVPQCRMDAPYPEIKRQSPKLNEETSHQQKPTTSTKLQPEFTRTFKDYIDAELRAAIKRLNPPHEPYPGDSNSVPNLANNKTKDEYRHGSNPKPELKGTKKSNDLLAEAGCLRPGLRPELKRRTSSRSTSPNLLTLDQIFEKFQGSASNSDQDEPTECSSCNADSSYITVDKTAALGVENASEVSCYVDALSHLSVHPAGAKPYRSLAKYTYNTPDEGKKPKERGSSMKIIRTKTKSSRRKDAERNTESSHAQEERADTAKPARLRSSRNKPKRKGDSTPSAMEPRPHKEINTTVRAVSINSSNTSNTFINNDCNYTDYQPSCESVCDSELATTRDNKEHTCGWKLDFENTTVTPSVPTSPRYHPSVSSTRYTKSGDKEDKVNSNVPKAAASINHNVSVWEYLEKDDTARASRGVKLSSGKGLLNKNGIHMG